MPIRYRGYGELSYGDDTFSGLDNLGLYTFPPTYTMVLNAKPVMLNNGLGVKYVRHELTVNWILPYEMLEPARWNNSNTPISVDTAVQQIRLILMQPGSNLTFTYQGLGEGQTDMGLYQTHITASTDKAGGPLPLDFKWKVLATQRCVEMSWTVAFHLDACIRFDAAGNKYGLTTNLNEFSYSRTYDYDDAGVATITTTGSIERRDYGFGKHIDHWRILAFFDLVPGFKRVSQKFQSEPNTRVLNFTITDKEVASENAYPPLVTDIDLSHEISSALVKGSKFDGTGFLSWNNVFSGSITLQPGVSPIYAYFLFHFYLRQRMNRVNSNGVAAGTVETKNEEDTGAAVGGFQIQEKVRTVLSRISYKESLFSRTHSFKAEYWALYSRDKFIKQSGIFLPLYNFSKDGNAPKWWYDANQSNSEPWQSSFNRDPSATENTLNSQWGYWDQKNIPIRDVYGYRTTSEELNDSYVYIPCYSNGDLALYPGGQKPANAPSIPKIKNKFLGAYDIENYIESQPTKANTDSDTSLSKMYVDPEISWIDYQVNFTVVENHNTAQVVRQSYDNSVKLGLQSYLGEGAPVKATKSFSINNGGASGADPPTGEVVSTFNGQSNTVIILSGYAIRAAYPTPMPSILTYKGSPVFRAGQATYSNRIISKGEIPVYLATWSIPYYIDSTKHADVFNKLDVNGYTGELG